MGFEDEAGFHFDPFNERALEFLQTANLEERFLNGSSARSLHSRMAGKTKDFALFSLVALLVVFPKTSNHLEIGESLGATVKFSKANPRTTTSDSEMGSGPTFAAIGADSRFGQKLCVRFSQIE